MIDSFSTAISTNLVETSEENKHKNPYPANGDNPSVSKEKLRIGTMAIEDIPIKFEYYTSPEMYFFYATCLTYCDITIHNISNPNFEIIIGINWIKTFNDVGSGFSPSSSNSVEEIPYAYVQKLIPVIKYIVGINLRREHFSTKTSVKNIANDSKTNEPRELKNKSPGRVFKDK